MAKSSAPGSAVCGPGFAAVLATSLLVVGGGAEVPRPPVPWKSSLVSSGGVGDGGVGAVASALPVDGGFEGSGFDGIAAGGLDSGGREGAVVGTEFVPIAGAAKAAGDRAGMMEPP